MNRLLVSSTAFAILAAYAPAQTYVQRHGPGTAYSGIAGDESLAQLLNTANDSSRVVDGAGAHVGFNAGYVGALGISTSGRQFLGVADPTAPANLGYVRDPAGQGLHRGVTDAVTGRVAFLAYDPSTSSLAWGIDTGSGAATAIETDGVVGVNGFGDISSISPTAFSGIAFAADSSLQPFVYDGSGYTVVPVPGTGQGFQNLLISADPGGALRITAIVNEASGVTWGAAGVLSGGNVLWSDLKVAGAIGVTQAWGGKAAFWSPYQAWTAELSGSTLSEIRTATGDSLSGVTSGFTRGGFHYLSGGFGAGTVQAVPEPASLAAVGLCIAALARRRRAGRSQ